MSEKSLEKMPRLYGPDTTVCPFCDMPFKDGDEHGIPTSKDTIQCSVSMLCDNPKSVGRIESL